MGRKRGHPPPGRRDDGTSSTGPKGLKSRKKAPDDSGIGTFGSVVSNQDQNDVQPSSSKTSKGDAGDEVKTGHPQSAPAPIPESQAVIDDLVGIPGGPGSDIGRKKTKATLPKQFKCSYCPRKYALKRSLQNHLRNKHDDQKDNSSEPRGKALVAPEDERGDPAEKLTEIEDYKKKLREKDEEIERLRKELNESRKKIAEFCGQDLSGENKSGQSNNADNEKPLEFQGGQGRKVKGGKMRRSDMAKKLSVGEEEDTLNQTEGSSKTAQKNGGEAEGKQESGRNSPCSSKSKLETSSEVATATATSMQPLENPLILNRLFKFCGVRVLANCRLVCKQWYQESLQSFRTNVLVSIKPDKVEKFESYDWVTKRSLPIHEFLAYVADPQNQCSSRPYRSIRILGCRFFGNSEQLEALWSPLLGIGVNLTSLNLFRCRFNGVAEFRKIIFEDCPNLQSLEVDRLHLNSRPWETYLTGDEEWVYRKPSYGKHDHLKNLWLNTYPGEFTFLWRELFSHFQSMTNFYVHFGSHSEFGDNEHDIKLLMGTIRAVRKHDPKALPLKCVKILPPPNILYCYPEAQQDKDIKNAVRVPLEFLLIKFGPRVNKTSLKNALDLYGETVKWIELSGTASTVRGQPFPFGVQLNELKTLEIGKKAFESMSFLQYTPNLERLVIAGNNSEETRQIVSNSCKLGMADVKIGNLKELELNYVVSDEDLASLIGWIPNLTNLKIPLNDKQFGMVCEKWRKLTKLVVPGEQLSDAGVTGIGDLEGKNKKGKKKQPLKDAIAALRPNITYLQELESFKFWGDRLSDLSVFHGFLKLPRLRHITFQTKNLRWGKGARRALGQREISGTESYFGGCRTVDFR